MATEELENFVLSEEAKQDLKGMYALDLKEELEKILGRPLTDEELGIEK